MWLASPQFYPTYGGAQNRYRNYIPGFLQRHLHVGIITGTPLASERSDADMHTDWYTAGVGTWLPTTTLDGVRLERMRLPDSNQRARTHMYYDALVEICGRPAPGPVVVQLLTDIRPEVRSWLKKLKQQGVATLASVSTFPQWPNKRMKRLFRLPGYRKVLNEFDAVVTNSEAIGDFLRGIGVSARIEYIPNGVDLKRFHPVVSMADQTQRCELRQRLGIPDDHVVVATVGALIPRKGPHHVILAWRQLLTEFPNTHLLLVGPRADLHNDKLRDFGEEIANAIASSGAPQQVHFTGVVNDVQNYLRAADILILASEREGTPNSVLEAMATGLPCIVTPFVGLSRGIGEPGENFILVDRTPEAIARELMVLLRDQRARIERGQRGHDFVLEKASLQRSLDDYAHLYQELGAAALARCAGRRLRLSR